MDTSGDEDEDEEEGGQFEAVAELVSRPEVGSLGLGVDAFVGRSGEDSWVRLGGTLDELWEDVVEELGEHLDWTGAGSVALEDYPAASTAEDEDVEVEDLGELDEEDIDVEALAGEDGAAATPTPGTSTISGGTRFTASPAAVAAAAEFWEAVGILPVEIVVREGAGLTLRCYVEDVARFLGTDGDIYVFETPLALGTFCSETKEDHDLTEIASWAEVAVTDTLPLPAEQDRYDLTELSDVLGEVADGAAGLVTHQALVQPVEGVRDIAEYAKLTKVDDLLAPSSALGRAIAIADRDPDRPLRAEDAAELKREWDEVVTAVSGALVFRD